MRLSLAVLCCAAVVGCGPETGLLLTLIPVDVEVDQARVQLLVDGASRGEATVPAEPKIFSDKGETLRLLVPDDAVDRTIVVAATGLSRGTEVAAGEASESIQRGVLTPVEVSLKANPTGCGDGVIAGTEACDDGNEADGDGCSAACTVDPGYQCDGAPSVCRLICGNGAGDEGEACDDGNGFGADGCSATCTIDPGYQCDGTPSVCRLICSNGALDDGEECDDGNDINGDGCSAACAIDPGYRCEGTPSVCRLICGNGAIDDGEECDDANIIDGDGCAGDCTTEPGYVCGEEPSVCRPTCGNGTLDLGEACDDVNIVEGDGCTANCVVEPLYRCGAPPSECLFTCGDGTLDVDTGEACDDGNAGGGDGCDEACVVEQGFTCSGSGCFPICGDGLLRGLEQCDDGPSLVPNDGCAADCSIEVGATCSGEPSRCSRGCLISQGGSDVIVQSGALDPSNSCFACDPDVSPLTFSPRPALTACGDNPDFCDGADICQVGDAGAFLCLPSQQNPCSGTTPSCFEPTDQCRCSGESCDDRAACNGVEACAGDGSCQPGAAPCSGSTPVCVEEGGGAVACFECVTASDCAGNANGPCCLNNQCSQQSGTCPCGMHDGGDGQCVADGTCSPNFVRPFVDSDGDGVGVGDARPECRDPSQLMGTGLAAEGGDCNDGDPAVDHLATVAPDADADGFTGAPEVRCIGATPPASFSLVPSPPPVPGLDATVQVAVAAAGVGWGASTDGARFVDGIAVTSDSMSSSVTKPLLFTNLGINAPADAQVLGVQVQIVRRRGSGGNQNVTVRDSSVRLVVNGAIAGLDHAKTTDIWPQPNFATATYGGSTDTWGISSLTPAVVNSSGFGVALSTAGGNGTRADVDGVRVDVFISQGEDCNDGDSTRSSSWGAQDDVDGDRFGATGSLSLRCITSQPRQDKLIRLSLGDDCYDANASVFPGQPAFFTVQRGDGSFDYDCTGTQEKQVVVDTTCSEIVDPVLAICSACNAATATVTPMEACGTNHDKGGCSNCSSRCAAVVNNTLVACR